MIKRIRSQIARGSAELAILALLAEKSLYGFEISRQIEERTEGALHFTLASLYPMLYDWKSAVRSKDAGKPMRPVGTVAITA
jgi:DNA-binding PadR family transcriptional regulator